MAAASNLMISNVRSNSRNLKIAFAGLCAAALATAATWMSTGMAAPGSVNSLLRLRSAHPASLNHLGSIYSFTPSTQDARLAAVYARAVLNRSAKSFRFTPTSGSVNGRRSVTVLVRAEQKPDQQRHVELGLAPVAFSLDVTRPGWRKIALPETSRRSPDLPISDLGGASGFSLERQRGRDTGPSAAIGQGKYGSDNSNSYSLTRNIKVEAGVKDPDRIGSITDKQQDRQAVYVGTTVKF